MTLFDFQKESGHPQGWPFLHQMGDAVEVLKQLSGFAGFSGVEDIVGRLEDHLNAVRHSG